MNIEQIITEEYYKIIKEQQKTTAQWPKGFKYGYSFGELGKDPVDERGGNKFRYGASMNKPILAFVNHVLAKEGALNTRSGNPIRRLNDEELDKMISYAKGSNWSNRVNRAASNMSRVGGKDPWGNETGYYDKYSKEVGVSKKQAQDVLSRLGLNDSIKGVHWGGAHNKQSTRGYHKFMSLLHQMKNDPEHEYHDEATRVLSFVNKRQGGQGARGLKKYLNKKLEKAGYGKNAVQSIYGKGGYVEGTLNYSVVINGKYVLSLYSKERGQKAASMRPKLHDIAFNTITKNLKPGQLGTGSPERQKQDAEIEDFNRREIDRASLKADWDITRPENIPAGEIDEKTPEFFDKELDLNKIKDITLNEQEEIVELPPMEIKAGKTISDKYKAINRNKKEVDRPYSAYIPPGTDLENANVAVYFHGWEKWREKYNKPFPHDKRLEKLKQTLPDNTVLIVPNLGINPQRSRPTKDFLSTVKNKLGIKNINNIKLYGHSAGGSAMSRYLKNLDDDTLKKTQPTYLDATYGYKATDDVVDRMKKLNLMKNMHFITKKGSRTDKKAKRFSDSGAKISRLTGKGSSHSALEVPPSWKQWAAKESLYERIVKEEKEDIGLSLKHPVLKGYKLTDEEYSNLDDIDKLNLLAAEEEASKTIPFPRVRTSNTPSKFSYGDTASPTYFKSPEFYEYEDSMRAVRGQPTKEQSQRDEELTDVVDTVARRSMKDFQDPQSIAMEDWLSLEDLKNLTDFATRSSSVSKEEAWSALQSKYPELFGAPGEPVELTKTFIDYMEKLYGPQDRARDKELDFREKDIFNRPLPVETEPPAHTLPVRRGSKLAENRIFKIIKEEYDKLLQEVTTPLIKVDIALKYERDFSFYGNVLNQIRSIKGIAIAKASDVGVIDVGPDKKMVLMHLKFMPDRPLHQYLTYLQVELKKIKDKDGDRIIATQIKGIPKEVEI